MVVPGDVPSTPHQSQTHLQVGTHVQLHWRHAVNFYWFVWVSISMCVCIKILWMETNKIHIWKNTCISLLYYCICFLTNNIFNQILFIYSAIFTNTSLKLLFTYKKNWLRFKVDCILNIQWLTDNNNEKINYEPCVGVSTCHSNSGRGLWWTYVWMAFSPAMYILSSRSFQ